MLPGRFFSGLGTGENLNEHVLGDRWPPTFVRREMLRAAIHVMRELWQGELTSHRGDHYTVENARLYALPDEPLEIMVAAGGPEAAELAGELGDGLVSTAPDSELVQAFDDVVSEEDIAEVVACGPDSQRHREAIQEYVDAGFDRVYVHQVGSDQEGFLRFAERELLPTFR